MASRPADPSTPGGLLHFIRGGRRAKPVDEPAARGLGVQLQIPRNSLALLMVAQAVVVLPHAAHLSLWIIAVGLFCGYWRTQVYRGRWGYPHRWVRAVLVVACIAGIVMSGVPAFSLEAATSLLLLAFALKLIEMKSRRDAYLVIFLSYFVIATEFLFDQSIGIAIYEVGAAVVVTAAMVGMNQLHTRVQPLTSLKLAASLVLQAVPLMIVLFLFFPRVAPLWTVPLPNAARTGLAEQMTPGDVANLTRSDELAFRAVFDGPVPRHDQLYWRALVYSVFENGTWSVSSRDRRTYPRPEDAYADVLHRYEILLEPTLHTWLVALDTPVAVNGRAHHTATHRLVANEPVLSVTRYEVVSNPALVRDARLSPATRRRETYLAPGDNPQIRAYAAEAFAAGGAVGVIDAMQSRIREEFSYTLQPPQLPRENSVDAFWFDTQRGFCTHFAGALVYALRSVGVPARLVGGYQGGELNPITGHLVVRQYDAHAWAEVHLPNRGWVRFDPTAAVAPARVEDGLHAALDAGERASLSVWSTLRDGNWAGLGTLLQWAESLEHRWNLWVIGYDTKLQRNYLTELLGELTPTRITIAMLIGGGLSLSAVALVLFWRRRTVRAHPVERLLQQFSTKLSDADLGRQPSESPAAYLSRVCERAGLDGESRQALIDRVDGFLYNPDVDCRSGDVRQLRLQLRSLRFRLAFGGTA